MLNLVKSSFSRLAGAPSHQPLPPSTQTRPPSTQSQARAGALKIDKPERPADERVEGSRGNLDTSLALDGEGGTGTLGEGGKPRLEGAARAIKVAESQDTDVSATKTIQAVPQRPQHAKQNVQETREWDNTAIAANAVTSATSIEASNEEPPQSVTPNEDRVQALTQQFDEIMEEMSQDGTSLRPKLVPKSRLGKTNKPADTVRTDESDTEKQLRLMLEEGNKLARSLEDSMKKTKTMIDRIDKSKKAIPSIEVNPTAPTAESSEVKSIEEDLNDLRTDEIFDKIRNKERLVTGEAGGADTASCINELLSGIAAVPKQGLDPEIADALIDAAGKQIPSFWEHFIVQQNANIGLLERFCEQLKGKAFFDLSALFIPELRLDWSHTTHENPMIARVLQVTKQYRKPVIHPTGPYENIVYPHGSLDISVAEMPGTGEIENGSDTAIISTRAIMAVPEEVYTKLVSARANLGKEKGWRLQQVNDIAWWDVQRPYCGSFPGKTGNAKALALAVCFVLENDNKTFNSMDERRMGAFLEEGMEPREFKNDFTIPYWKVDEQMKVNGESRTKQPTYEELCKELRETRHEGRLLRRAIMNNLRKVEEKKDKGGELDKKGK